MPRESNLCCCSCGMKVVLSRWNALYFEHILVFFPFFTTFLTKYLINLRFLKTKKKKLKNRIFTVMCFREKKIIDIHFTRLWYRRCFKLTFVISCFSNKWMKLQVYWVVLLFPFKNPEFWYPNCPLFIEHLLVYFRICA